MCVARVNYFASRCINLLKLIGVSTGVFKTYLPFYHMTVLNNANIADVPDQPLHFDPPHLVKSYEMIKDISFNFMGVEWAALQVIRYLLKSLHATNATFLNMKEAGGVPAEERKAVTDAVCFALAKLMNLNHKEEGGDAC